jgi:hypothetical protein
MHHRTLRNIETQHLQLTVNARCAPGLVFGDHAEDQFPQFPDYTLSPHSCPVLRKPHPIQLETGSMPASDRFRLDQDQRASIPAKASATSPKSVCQSRQSVAEDASVSKLQAVAEEPDF